MTLLDIHSHNSGADGNITIFNCKEYIADGKISIGIHPWDITENWKNELEEIKLHAEKENVIAIGECGIDKQNSSAPTGLQQEIFKAQALIAEKAKKPLIIHCVKGYDEILAIRKDIQPKQAWIIHGFRGKPQMAKQLVKAGLYISFGEKFNSESIKETPLERLFLESDDSKTDIREIYTLIAGTKGCSINELAAQTVANAKKCNIML